MRLQTQILLQVEHEFDKAGVLGYRSYEVLVALMQAEGQQLRLSDLADRVGLSRSGLTRMVDRLEKDGLLRRDRSPLDGRGINAHLNEPGREAVRRAWPTYRACVEHWLGHTLDAPDREFLRQICRRLMKIPDRGLESQEVWD
ncbi:MAG: MarR family transcriptional regulator [Candidatus Eremiobacteraeota bacterium]|nr:MarR family transcriptional regulator [Candidatus Eremiobacteraeota bacterium]MCW5866301.1 MarR family transcriptional regulator [Candidatus Eremiobacteraeota bacterium]